MNSEPTKTRIVVAATGSVAAMKLPELLRMLLPWAQVKLVTSESARKFFLLEEIEEMRMMGQIEWLCDMDQQAQWTQRGDPVLHIQLRKWAQIYLIAPLSANSLAKLANGLCDNLVTLVGRCWDMKLREDGKLIKPILVCPAMNTLMWEHPATAEHLTKLQKWGYTIVDPVQKILICGDQGKGAMAKLESIVDSLKVEMKLSQIPLMQNIEHPHKGAS